MNKNQINQAPLRILVLGANGGIGQQCVSIALDAGHQVTAVLRTPSKLKLDHPNLQIVKGDVTEPATFSSQLQNADVVISAIGVSGGFGSDKPTTLYSKAAANIVQRIGEKRAFFISASALEISPVVPFFVRFVIRFVVQKLLKHMYEDLRRMEGIVKGSHANWTIMRPPELTDKPLTGEYRTAINTFLKNGLKISRADVAHFMLHNVLNEQTYRATIEIAY